MFVLLIFLPLLYLSFVNCNPFLESDIYHILYGNLSNVDDLLPEEFSGKPPREVPDMGDDEIPDEEYFELHKIFGFKRSDFTNETFALNDFLKIEEGHKNFTRNLKATRRMSWEDYHDIWAGERGIEPHKQFQIKSCLIHYVLHTRYQVGKALAQRVAIRNEKRYKLGYLFNRMRRLKTEILKMAANAVHQYEHYVWHQMYSQMRLYERIVHFDTDMRDTAEMIKTIFHTPDACDWVDATKEGGRVT